MKFSQYTLTQVAGFDGQIIAEQLVYDQKEFWNLQYGTTYNTNNGWTTVTTPTDLTGATIDAQIIRRSITDLKDGRTGLNFTIHDYPFPALITPVTAADATDDTFTCTDTSQMYVDQPIRFTGTVFGGVAINTTYYVKEVITETTFTISATQGGGTFALTTATGSMRADRAPPTAVNLPISNIVAANGSFTVTIDDDTWDVIAGDPELDINATDPICFTGRIKVSYPAVGSQPAWDEIVFMLFLITSDGVVN